MNIDQKRIVITGASSGIGRALLSELSSRRVQVVPVGRDETGLREAVRSVEAPRAKIMPFTCDVALQRDVDDLFEYATLAVRSRFFQTAGDAPVPWLSQSPGTAARAMLRGIEKDQETIYTSWLLPPMLLVNHLLPFTRRWYQAMDSKVSRQHWATTRKQKSENEKDDGRWAGDGLDPE